MYIAINWVTYAFVDATAISGPAHVYNTSLASLETELPTTLVTANTLAPFACPSLKTAKVSAVSPDWLNTIIKVLSVITASLYLNSEAISTSTGILTNFSIAYFPITPAW